MRERTRGKGIVREIDYGRERENERERERENERSGSFREISH